MDKFDMKCCDVCLHYDECVAMLHKLPKIPAGEPGEAGAVNIMKPDYCVYPSDCVHGKTCEREYDVDADGYCPLYRPDRWNFKEDILTGEMYDMNPPS